METNIHTKEKEEGETILRQDRACSIWKQTYIRKKREKERRS
jgi:hypothetical protein